MASLVAEQLSAGDGAEPLRELEPMAEAAHRYPGARNPDFRRVLVTGALGKVGVRVVQAFHADKSGKPWEVVSTDVARGVFVRLAAILPRSACRCRWLTRRAGGRTRRAARTRGTTSRPT